jgi:phage shock protein PspC (stress-responsive transcriptional regulator)
VCSGIAAYMNVDPAIVRILFAIISFGGFGFGFLAYIILWIVLPPKDLEGFIGKRLYRNPDDRIIGGVAGGLAAYFGKRANTIRLIFAAPLILSLLFRFIDNYAWDNDIDWAWNIGFASLTGTFILAYIILWIVLPEAVSDYQKMEMRGETVDINRIRQNVREGMDNMKEKMKSWSAEVKSSSQQFSSKAKEFTDTRGREFVREVVETTRRRGGGLGHAIGVLFKVFFLFIAGTIAFALFVTVIALLFGGIAWWPVNNFLWTSSRQEFLAWATLILFLLVPLIGFITWIIRRIIRAKAKSNYLGWTFGGLWALGWVAVVFFAASISKDFREYEHVDSSISINQPVNGKMIVAVSKPELEYTGGFGWIR